MGSVKPMSTTSKLKRHFLATFPVLGPHMGIEAELLLAGIKPIGLYNIWPEGTIFPVKNKPEALEHKLMWLKNFTDIEKLDQAVQKSTLMCGGIEQYPDQEQNPSLVEVFYYQPNINLEKAINELSPGQYLGYRKRDQFLFENCYNNMPLPIKQAVSKLNKTSQYAYQCLQLEQCGIKNPEQYLRDQKQELQEKLKTWHCPYQFETQDTLELI